jgi:hypothetical protein
MPLWNVGRWNRGGYGIAGPAEDPGAPEPEPVEAESLDARIFREDAILEDVVARLKATNLFGQVVEGNPKLTELPDDHNGAPAKAWVQHYRTTRADQSDSPDERRVSAAFYLWIEVRHEEPVRAFRALSLAEALAMNAVENRRLALVTVPARTRITDQLYQEIPPPARRSRLTLTAEFFRPAGGYDEADRLGEELP